LVPKTPVLGSVSITISPLDTKLILDEIAKLNRRFDESYARMERCFSRTLAALEPRGDAVVLGTVDHLG
jgi:hypothetical protein